MSDFWVNGIVAARDGEPYVQLSNEDGMIAQLTFRDYRAQLDDEKIEHTHRGEVPPT